METIHPALKPVKPSECALAITIPLTRDRFFADLEQPHQKDLVHHFRASKGLEKAEAEFLWSTYEHDEALFVQAVCNESSRRGVEVKYDVRLDDFSQLLKHFSVVTLVAHWRFVPVTAEDILDPDAFLQTLREPGTLIHEMVRRRFEVLDPELLKIERTQRLDQATLQRRIAAAVEIIVAEAEASYLEPSDVPEAARAENHSTERLTRLEFETAFPSAISPSRSVEFADSLYSASDLVDAIPARFSGLLDLTVCNSVIPAGVIRQRRPNCLVAANRKPAQLKSNMYLYGLQISLLAKTAMPFVDVITKVHSGRSAYKLRSTKRWNLFAKFFDSIRIIS